MIIYVDASVKDNRASVGIVIRKDGGRIAKKIPYDLGEVLYTCENMIEEYGIILAIKHAKKGDVIRSDSRTAIENILRGHYSWANAEIAKKNIRIEWVPRSKNSMANDLARRFITDQKRY